MKRSWRKIAFVALFICIAGQVFALDGSESLGFYTNLGKNPRFVGGSFTFSSKIFQDIVDGFNSETYLNAGSSSYDDYRTDNDEKILDKTSSGVFFMAGENIIYGFDLGFFSPRIGMGFDIGIFSADGDIKFGGMAGLVAGIELFADKVVSIVCDIRPSLDLYGTDWSFAAPLTVSVRLHNKRIKL